MGRLVEERGIINLFEPLDYVAGADSDSFSMAKAAEVDIIVTFGVVTGDTAVLTVYSGATAGTKTTKEPFSFRLSGADFKAAGADLFGAETADADGDLTLTAATYESRILVIHLDAATLTADQPWVTLQVGTTTANFISAVAILKYNRYLPAVTAI